MAACSSNLKFAKILRCNRDGLSLGVYSVCSAHPVVILAALELARDRRQLAVIESTCNQVNQDGGYTGLTPYAFAEMVKELANEVGLKVDDLVLGGDHLGPQPWRNLPASEAMAKAVVMVKAYASAGFGKLHIDCSMACADDPAALTDADIAERAAQLVLAAESVSPVTPPVYIVGTEVPAPGGMGEGHAITPTLPAAVQETWDAHRIAFDKYKLSEAFTRIAGIVVQPGLDFGNDTVVHFEPKATTGLASSVSTLGHAVFEAHSTDYQLPRNYVKLIEQHFSILKVGPAATFALREAIFALDALARELPGWEPRYAVRDVLDAAMCTNPSHWGNHYSGDDNQLKYLRQFSYSDRVRYYWTDPTVALSVASLFQFLNSKALPLPLVSQYFPQHYAFIADGKLSLAAVDLCKASVKSALSAYADACGDHAAALLDR